MNYKHLAKGRILPRDSCGIKEDGDGAVRYHGTASFVHARKGTLCFGLDLLFGVHPPARFTELVVAPNIEYLIGRRLVITDPTNEASSTPLFGNMADRIGFADRLEDGVGGLHEPVYQFVDIPTKMSQ